MAAVDGVVWIGHERVGRNDAGVHVLYAVEHGRFLCGLCKSNVVCGAVGGSQGGDEVELGGC